MRSRTSCPEAGPFVITGFSGSGKTVFTQGLEDIGYHCVDNVPLELVQQLFEGWERSLGSLVVVLDMRTPGFDREFLGVYKQLKEKYPDLRLVFVEATKQILWQRFSQVRRPHPVEAPTLEEAIEREFQLLYPIREMADLVIDTSQMEPVELRRHAVVIGGVGDPDSMLLVSVESFSYLHGIPAGSNLVFDVRFLPNPYWVSELRDLPGDDPKVSSWLMGQPGVPETVDRLAKLVLDVAPKFASQAVWRFIVSVGCTGGRHRSVFVARELARIVERSGYQVLLHHRDRDRWRGSR